MNIVLMVVILNKTIFIFKITTILTIIIIFCSYFYARNYISTGVFNNSTKRIIIDAGHGLPDGGAIAKDGTIESNINLAIAIKISNCLTKAGFECILTRCDESSIFTEGSTIHAKKVSDIKVRIKIANIYPNTLFLSIHMNTYPAENVYGTQIFYKPTCELSKSIAQEMQRIINLKYQPDNNKTIKPIPSNVYLFNHINNPCILAECGFLTNNEDLHKLKDDNFQSEIAKSISEIIIYKLTGSELNGN